jgi:glycosyltransferase involved in cell wall biosynthesis
MDGNVGPPSLSIVMDTSVGNGLGAIRVEHALAALRAQAHPHDHVQIIAVMYGAAEPIAPVLGQFAVHERVVVPIGTGYYEAKRRGVEQADGEIVAFVDADNLALPDWARQITLPFVEHPDVLVVLGRHRFRQARLSRFWDILWWDRSFENEGPIDKLSAANNVAFRREALTALWYPDLGRMRGVWERAMTDAMQRRGTIWFAPAARVIHDFSPSLRGYAHLAYARGFNLLTSRRLYPRGIQKRFGPIRWLLPLLAFPALLAKDVRRLFGRFSGAGYTVVTIPPLLAAIVVADAVSLAGMIRALRRGGGVEPP